MRRFFLSVLVAATALLSANDPTIYRDEDSGLVLEIPGGLTHTWSLSHSEKGLDFHVFQTNEYPMYLVVTGRLPLKEVLGEGSEGLFAQVLSEFQSGFDAESSLKFESLPSLASDEYASERMRVHFIDEEEEVEDLYMDMHLFLKDTQVTIIGTILYSPEEGGESIEDFSKAVLETVRFIEE